MNVDLRACAGLCLLLCSSTALLSPSHATAAPAEAAPGGSASVASSSTDRYSGEVALVFLDGSLQGLIEEIALLGGVKVRFNDRVDEVRVTNISLRGTLRELLDDVSKRYSITWFAERDLIEINKAESAIVKTYSAKFLTDSRIRDAVQRFGLVNVDSALGVDEKSGFIRVFGPPRLQDRLEAIMRGLRPPQLVDETMNVIRFGVVEQNVFRGEGGPEATGSPQPSVPATKPQPVPPAAR